MSYTLEFGKIDETQLAVVGGKGVGLARLARIPGLRVPPGFCVTTRAFDAAVATDASLPALLERLADLHLGHDEAARALSAELRQTIAALAFPEEVAAAITRALVRLGDRTAGAVRSSATAEDLRDASFAGQQDSFLNVTGAAAVLEHVRRCWASLYAERAVSYRAQRSIDHRAVRMAVVMQRMVVAEASGVLFTADPVTSNRRAVAVEAIHGLGEALVSGRVTPDVHEVRDGEELRREIAVKRVAMRPSPGGATREEERPREEQQAPALSQAQVLDLAWLGRLVEAHLGTPQDLEWCLADGELSVVQSRPITTLFSVPEAADDALHVYLSVGHQQMMTDAMTPLGLSVWQPTTPRPMAEAGGRLFVDVAAGLASPATRDGLLAGFSASDPLTGDALRTVVERGDLPAPDPAPEGAPSAFATPAGLKPLPADPAIVDELVAACEASVADLRERIAGVSGVALLDLVLADVAELKRVRFAPRSHQVLLAAMDAAAWLDERLEAWLGEPHLADVLTWSVPGNVTSEMGLALLDVADAIRPHPAVVTSLEEVLDDEDDEWLNELDPLSGGREAADALCAFLARYGMRCAGEIDITRPRWSERPGALVPTILTHVRTFAPGAAARHFEEGRRAAESRAREVLERLRTLPGGEAKAQETAAMIERLRTFTGYRDFPKAGMVTR